MEELEEKSKDLGAVIEVFPSHQQCQGLVSSAVSPLAHVRIKKTTVSTGLFKI